MEEHYFLIDHIRKNKRYNLTALAEDNYNEVTIGRLHHGASIEVGWENLSLTKFISRHHATITSVGNVLYLTDNNSAIGTFVNGKRLSDAGHILNDGDKIYIGEHYGPLEIKSVQYPIHEHSSQ